MLNLFLPLFLVLLLMGLPVFFGLIAAPGLLLWANGQERDLVLLYRNVYNGMDSFPLMAIPFFMMAGELMNRGGITLRLVEFSQAVIGHLRGGLAHVNVMSSMLFGVMIWLTLKPYSGLSCTNASVARARSAPPNRAIRRGKRCKISLPSSLCTTNTTQAVLVSASTSVDRHRSKSRKKYNPADNKSPAPTLPTANLVRKTRILRRLWFV